MARLPRFVIPDQPQHVILRGNNRAEIFWADADYSFYLEKLKLACDKRECSVHAYVLMTNHVYLLITPTKAWAKPCRCWGVTMCNTTTIATGAPEHSGKAATKRRSLIPKLMGISKNTLHLTANFGEKQ
jgi:REP element-mobilizing transposase RayT